MKDALTTVQELRERVAVFITDRDWKQFHTPKNLSMNLVREATELMEKFLWMELQESHKEVERNRQEIEDEVADVLFGLLAFCNATSIDLTTAFEKKITAVAQKYPVAKAKGCCTKYNKL